MRELRALGRLFAAVALIFFGFVRYELSGANRENLDSVIYTGSAHDCRYLEMACWRYCLRMSRNGVEDMADVSAVDREAARVLASLNGISATDLEEVVEGRIFRGTDFGAAHGSGRLFRPLYDIDGSRLER